MTEPFDAIIHRHDLWIKYYDADRPESEQYDSLFIDYALRAASTSALSIRPTWFLITTRTWGQRRLADVVRALKVPD